MARFHFPDHSTEKELSRRLLHFDHLKTINNVYQLMRDEQTIARMKDPNFTNDHAEEKKLDEVYFTSLVIRLKKPMFDPLFEKVEKAYREIEELIQAYHPEANVDIYFDTAHITVKSISREQEISWEEMEQLTALIKPVVHDWVGKMANETKLFARGLFSHLHPKKGLSLGIRFFPSTTLVQQIRGETGMVVYEAGDRGAFREDMLNPEANFHTLLTHSTGMRARGFQLPFHPDFVEKFEALISGYDKKIFGYLTDLTPGDFFLGNCQSDRYVINEAVGKEVCMGENPS